MAPISSQWSTQACSSGSDMTNCGCSHSHNSLWNYYLPITRRGLFFQDSYFEKARSQLEAAVQDMVAKWGETSLVTDKWDDGLSNNSLTHYRQLRAHNLKQENQAAVLTSDNTDHKIVMDVHEFLEGELKVKVVGEREVMVEGNMEAKNGNFSISKQSFRRRFNLPQFTNMEAITALISSDGILTISAPKTINQEVKTTNIPIKVDGATSVKDVCTSTSQTVSENSSSSKATKTVESNKVKNKCDSCGQEYGAVSGTVRQEKVHKIPIKINTDLVENKQQSHCESKLEKENHSSGELQSNSSFTKNKNKQKQQMNKDTNTEVKIQTQKDINATTSKVQESSSENTFLPITRRGHFFTDSFFTNIREDFQNKVNEIVREWRERDCVSDKRKDTQLGVSNNMCQLRQLRADKLKEENQAITLVSDNSNHKIVMDVADFMDGEVKVEVVGERKVKVKGHVETNKDTDFVSSRSFTRQISLPDLTDMTAISSVMSSDGILTIIAPKTTSQKKSECLRIPVQLEDTNNHNDQDKNPSTTTSQAASSNATSSTNSKFLHTEQHTCDTHKQQANKEQPIKINGIIINNENDDVVQGSTTESTKFTSQSQVSKNSSSDLLPQSNLKKTKSNSTETDCEIKATQGKTCSSEGTRRFHDQSKNTSNIPEKSSLSCSSQQSEEEQSESCSSCTHLPQVNLLPVTTRGIFFNDSFFRDSWKDFQEAVRDVVAIWGDRSSLTDDWTSYRRIRTQDMKEENQAIKSSEDESNYKIVVDVQDFINGGNIKVKAVNDREIVVEGHTEKEESGCKYKQQFHRGFVLPNNICLESVSSVMSSDGVLTIMAPKKPSTLQVKEDIVPMSVEEGRVKTHSANQSSSECLKTGSEQHNAQVVKTDNNMTEGSCKSTKTVTTSSSVTEASKQEKCEAASVSFQAINKETHKKEHIIPMNSEQDEVSNKDTSYQAKQMIDVITEEKDTNEKKSQSKFSVSSNHQKAESEVTQQDVQSVNSGAIPKNKVCDTQLSQNKQEVFTNTTDHKYLPISQRGPFYSDSFFDNARENFVSAIRNVMEKASESSSQSDLFTSYRSLRQQELTRENQAVHVQENGHCLKVVMDVYDFIGGDVTVKVNEGKELLVEGKAKKEDGGSVATISFRQRFSLPRHVDVDGITSAMSCDGVLSVMCPKKQESSQSDTLTKEMFVESESRMDSQSVGARSWA